MPFADNLIIPFLNEAFNNMAGIKTQHEITLEAGYDKPDILSMIKRGEARLPLDRVPALARALNVDPALLFRLAMDQYWPSNMETSQTLPAVTTARGVAEEFNRLVLRTATHKDAPPGEHSKAC